MWFEALTGFPEKTPEQVRQYLTIKGNTLTSNINGATYLCGRLETPTLGELRQRVQAIVQDKPSTVREAIANVQSLHLDTSNAGALFQVASQFNLLEMVSPKVTPEQGVGIYEYDRTQGPACAIAAGAGTIYRNYFAELNGQQGQSADNQIDCLADVGEVLGNTDNCLWQMKNGYALASKAGLKHIQQQLQAASNSELETLRACLRVGIQWDTQVTLQGAQHTLTQVYCSALPVAYTPHPAAHWSEFAQLILTASYEACLCAAVLNYHNTGNNKVFLTLIGGGVFGNQPEWIMQAMLRALNLYRHAGLDVAVVSYGQSNQHVQTVLESFCS